MKLITKEVEKQIPEMYSTELVEMEDKRVAVKFFTPDSNWTWYVIEGKKQEDGDWSFFGLVDGFEKEWGYFTLSELKSVHGSLGLPIERDLYFGNPTIKEAGL